MADGTILFIPPNSVSIIQAGRMTPRPVIQTSGILQYAGQQLRSLSDRPPLFHQARLREKLQKVETKTLGAIQIIIGLVHIGFGSVSVVVHDYQSTALATSAGYPFWGGVFFIVSGSLSISAEKRQTIFLVKGNIGMNIASAAMAMIGMALYLVNLALHSPYSFSYESTVLRSIGLGLDALLLIFSSLEFGITVWTIHFWCQATSSGSDVGMMFDPYNVRAGGAVPAETNPSPPPPYDYVVSDQKNMGNFLFPPEIMATEPEATAGNI